MIKATFKKVLLGKVKLYTWVVLVLTTGFVFLNCKTNPKALFRPAKEIKVLMAVNFLHG